MESHLITLRTYLNYLFCLFELVWRTSRSCSILPQIKLCLHALVFVTLTKTEMSETCVQVTSCPESGNQVIKAVKLLGVVGDVNQSVQVKHCNGACACMRLTLELCARLGWDHQFSFSSFPNVRPQLSHDKSVGAVWLTEDYAIIVGMCLQTASAVTLKQGRTIIMSLLLIWLFFCF